MENRTTCSTCGYTSRRQQGFLEIDLNLKTNSTVEECLDLMQTPELLQGENRYQCPQCQSLQTASRTSIPTHLPPVLNISLMRFTYTPSGRVKSKAAIRYGNKLKVSDTEYDLIAVVTHLGTSAHHGHFVCDVFDPRWVKCKRR